MDSDLIERSFKYCEEIAKNHYENFPVASRLIPEDKRKYIFSIYAFARQADDYADEENFGSKEERLQLIDEWSEKLRRCYNGEINENEIVFIALAQTVKDCMIPVEPLENLLKAFRQDVVKNRYETFDEVLSYCKKSANPVGRLVLMVFGCRDESMFKYSDYICTALQLTNFWQDVSVDFKKDRVYIPSEDMEKFEYSSDELFDSTTNKSFKKLMKFEVERTEALFEKGKELIALVAAEPALSKFKKELKLILLGGMEILSKIKKQDYDVLTSRPVLSGFDKAKLFAKAIT